MNGQKYRGYISHCMIERSVPQSIQQQIIRVYCEKNEFQFLLSSTEFAGSTIMLDSIAEHGIVMYSIFCMPRSKEARKRLYASEKDVHFAAENMKMNPELVEIVFGVYDAGSSICDTATYLKQARLFCTDERGEAKLYEDCQGVWTDILGRTT